MIRGYETSLIGAGRDLLLFLPIIVMAFWVSAFKKFKGNWVLFTTAILLFSVGMLVQYRLYSDPEYNARNKAAARQEKDRHAADALHQPELRCKQATDDGAAAQTTPFRAGSPGQGIGLYVVECDHLKLHVDSGFLSAGFRAGLFRSASTIGSCRGFSETVLSSCC
jgi:hypothetical protein